MRTQSIDTQPEAERVMIELIRRAPMSKRFRLVQSLTQGALWSSFHAWRERHRETSEREAALYVVSTYYGASLAQCVQEALEKCESWHAQPIDLMAAMLTRGARLRPPGRVLLSRRLDCQLTARDAAARAGYRPAETGDNS